MLCAFLGDDVAEWVCAGCRIESLLASHWLVLRSAADTFARGFWRVEPLEGYPCKVCYGLFALFLGDPCLAQPKLTGG